MVIVPCVYLDKHIIFPGSEMTFHHFRYCFQSLGYRIERLRIFQINPNISTCLVPDLLRVDDILRTFQYTQISQLLYALMNSRTRNIARSCHFQERNAGVVGNQLQNLLV